MTLLQTLITAGVAILASYRGALTRTSHLRGSIRADLELRDAFPEDSPTREMLTAHAERLAGTLIRREARQFRPIVPAGATFGAVVAFAVLMLAGGIIQTLEAVGLRASDPPARADLWPTVVACAVIVVACAGYAVRALRNATTNQPDPAA